MALAPPNQDAINRRLAMQQQQSQGPSPVMAPGQPTTTFGGQYVSPPMTTPQTATEQPGQQFGGGTPIAPPPSNAPGPVQPVGQVDTFQSLADRSLGGGGGANFPQSGQQSNGGSPKHHKSNHIDPNSLAAFLAGDPEYQHNIAAADMGWKQYLANFVLNRGNAWDTFFTTKNRLADEQHKAEKELLNDYAARGMINSGLFATAQHDQGQDYTQQGTDLRNNLDNLIAQMRQDKLAKQQNYLLTKQQLRDAAVAKRADRYNIRK